MATPSLSFTTTSNSGLKNVLQNQCGISQFFDPDSDGVAPDTCQFDAIWDTGATNSIISQAVVDACGLAPTGMVMVRGVHGELPCETYLVNIALPNQLVVWGVQVTKANMVDADVLIGMDIINRGDFAVTNLGGVTKFSFRYPSQTHIDFVKESQKQSQTPQVQHGARKTERPKRHKSFGKNKRKK